MTYYKIHPLQISTLSTDPLIGLYLLVSKEYCDGNPLFQQNVSTKMTQSGSVSKCILIRNRSHVSYTSSVPKTANRRLPSEIVSKARFRETAGTVFSNALYDQIAGLTTAKMQH